MSCNSCSTKSDTPKGCKSNGSCATGSCDKLNVFDWLANMELPTGGKPFPIVEVKFKNGRKQYCINENNLPLTMGEVIAVEGSPGHDIGVVSLTGELVKIQMRKKQIAEDSEEIIKIYRKASVKDIETWEQAREKEIETQTRGREIILKLGLKMKLSDVEYQGDGNKATFYYTADERVDFRQLIRDLAATFSIRVEMKQVGLRQEAARLGGVGSCGRELCCSTWLTDFRKVNTSAARYQQLSLNPQKLAGQCGKLKCCLNYELDTYLDSLKVFPSQDVLLKTEKGTGVFVKMDIFKQLMWYAYKEERSKWYKLTLDQVLEIIAENKEGNLVESLEEFDAENVVETKIEFENVVGQDSLTRFDTPKKKNKRPKNNNRPKRTGDQQMATTAEVKTGEKQKNKGPRNATQNKNRKPGPQTQVQQLKVQQSAEKIEVKGQENTGEEGAKKNFKRRNYRKKVNKNNDNNSAS